MKRNLRPGVIMDTETLQRASDAREGAVSDVELHDAFVPIHESNPKSIEEAKALVAKLDDPRLTPRDLHFLAEDLDNIARGLSQDVGMTSREQPTQSL